MFALLDCNNFYVSCERVFQPQYEKVPLVVLSNNDGCIISRSNEVKKLGIGMGAPAFKYKTQFKKHGIKVFSSNYALYADMSNRVMNILESSTPNVEIYSIDEAFLQFYGFDYFNLVEHAHKIKNKIKKWTGIPVSIGIAPTKSLAKIANKIAKKFTSETLGVYNINSEEKIIKALHWTSIDDVWGIGFSNSKLLRSIGVDNALSFTKLSDYWIKKNMNVLGLRLKKDLLGLSHIKLDKIKNRKKSIATTRSFENSLNNLPGLEERIATFAISCAEKLRKQNSCCNSLLVFLKSNAFKKEKEQYNNSCLITLSYASNSNLILSKKAIDGLRKIFKAGISYKKAGVLALDIIPQENRQFNLFESNITKHDNLMNVIDNVNYRYRSNQIKLANQDLHRTWKMKQNNLSPRFTTVLEEIIKVK
tara:strand:+ start:15113 stop:16372 length:1260 start_codon:yes stop_codon:yes gene_type:complete